MVRIRVRSTTPNLNCGAAGVDLVGTLFRVAVRFGTIIRVASVIYAIISLQDTLYYTFLNMKSVQSLGTGSWTWNQLCGLAYFSMTK